MANKEQVEQLLKGDPAVSSAWLRERNEPLDLNRAYLARANLRNTNLIRAKLLGADLRGADLRSGTCLWEADLSGADLSTARLIDADLRGAKLRGADLSRGDLSRADLSADLRGANLSFAKLGETILTNSNLGRVVGLEACVHLAPSFIDFRTLQNSIPLPLVFLRGVGLPDNVIDFLPSLLGQPIQYYSCFISYSSKDDDFAKRIHVDLQSKGVRCWFAPHDLPIGGKILDEIDAAIRLREKLLVILSEHSINSDWVEDEVKTAYEEERRRGQTVLFPLRIDDSIMETTEAWAAKVRADRNIGDFRRWKEHDQYQASLERVVHDLAASPKEILITRGANQRTRPSNFFPRVAPRPARIRGRDKFFPPPGRRTRHDGGSRRCRRLADQQCREGAGEAHH